MQKITENARNDDDDVDDSDDDVVDDDDDILAMYESSYSRGAEQNISSLHTSSLVF